MTKLCPRGKAAAKRKFRVYPSAYANAYASKICAGKIKDPSGVKRKDFRGSKAEGGLMEATARLKRQGLKSGEMVRPGLSEMRNKVKKLTDKLDAQKRDRAKVKTAKPSKEKPRRPDMLGPKDPRKEKRPRLKDIPPISRVKKAGGGLMEATARLKRQGLKAGGKGCKLAMKGRGRAYGKNS